MSPNLVVAAKDETILVEAANLVVAAKETLLVVAAKIKDDTK